MYYLIISHDNPQPFLDLIILALYLLFVSNLCLVLRANTRSEKIVCYKYEPQGCWHKNAATFFIFEVVKIAPPQHCFTFNML